MPFSFTTLSPLLAPTPLHPGTTHSLPLLLLRLEGATLFFSGIYLYHRLQQWHRRSITTTTTTSSTSIKDPLSWTRFGILILVPDLGMVGFLRDSRWGSWIYNAVHCEVVPLILVATLVSDVLDLSVLGGKKSDGGGEQREGAGNNRVLGLRKGTWAKWMGVGITWLAHIGMDRMIGAGLKYETGFGHTHVGVMG